MKKILAAFLIALPALAELKARNSIIQGAPVSVLDKGAFCNGIGDDSAGFAVAIAALPATGGGTVDARGCAAMKLGSTLTINRSGTKILLPAGTVVLGTSQISIPLGVHSVTIEGSSSFGSGSAGTTMATNITYSGNSAAIVVGSNLGVTTGFQMKNLSVATNAGGAAAIGLQLNTVIDYTLSDVRITSNQTQWNIDLEGFLTYTGGSMYHVWLDGNNGEAIHFGKAANANYIHGAHIAMGVGVGTCFNFDGGGASSGGNRIFGGDCENALTVMRFDFTSDNEVFGLRAESCTNVAVATANSAQNWAFTSGTNAMTVTDAGANNVFTDNYWTQLGRTLWKMKNVNDVASTIILQAGATVAQLIEIQFANFGENWRVQHLSDNSFRVTRNSTSVSRLRLDAGANGNSHIASEGTGAVVINGIASSGTGGLIVQNGSAVTKIQIFGTDGRVGFVGVLQAALGTPANGSIQYCSDCTVANPCAGGGTGALAKRLNGVWVCN